MPRDLVLLTHQYPHRSGDASFVEAEIWSLSRSFDKIYVWTLTPSGAELVDTPTNVIHMGSLLSHSIYSPRLILAGLRSPVWFIRLIASELRLRRGRVRWSRLVRGTSIALTAGLHLDHWFQKSIAPGSAPVIYSFWGTDIALSLLTVSPSSAATAIRLHGYDLYEDRVGHIPYRKQLFERADMLLASSANGARYLTNLYKDSPLPPVIVSRLGTFDQGMAPGGPRDLVRVVSCSSLIELKRVDLIYRVANQLAETRPVQWVHFGDGPLRNALTEEIEKKNQTLDVDLRGNVPREEVLEFYSKNPVTFFINLSTTEGLPVSIMEALSFNIPVLATDVGGTGEVVSESAGSGLLVSPRAQLHEIVASATSLLEIAESLSPRQVWHSLCNADENGHETALRLRRLKKSNGVPAVKPPPPT